MADASEIREWARSEGIDVSTNGRVSAELRARYEAAHNGHEAPAPDYPEGMTDADFDLADATIPDALMDDLAESRPSRPKASSRSTPKTLRDRFKRGRTGAKRKPKQPRISTADLIGSIWRVSAKIAQPLPPMYRTLRLQSVIAGPLLDDAVKGTMVDPFLQPLARLAQSGETVTALLAPNLAIGAMAYHLSHVPEGQAPNPVVLQGCQELLRHGLLAMMRVGGDAFAAQLAREREDEERYGGSVDMIMEWLLSAPADPAAEEANIARMAARFAGQPDPEPSETMPA